MSLRVREGACPRCRIPLVGVEHPRSTPLVCPRCRGVHLRGDELRAHFGGAIAMFVARQRVPLAEPLQCPKGCGLLMGHRLAIEPRPVEIDSCDVCSGVWFDGGEVQAIFEAHRQHRLAAPRPAAPPRASSDEHRLRKVQDADNAIATEDDEASAGGEGVGMWIVQFLTQLPLEGNNPVYRAPIWTWTFIVSCVLLFVLSVGAGLKEVFDVWAWIPAKVMEGDRVLGRFVGSMFLHGGLFHLLGNMYFLKIFGDNVEDRLGRTWFPIMYASAGLVAVLAHHLSDTSSPIPMIGASGAISGVIGAYMVFFPNVRVRIAPSVLTLFNRFVVRAVFYFPFWFLFQVFAVMIGGEGVAWWAHIGGFVFGAVFAQFIGNKLPDARALKP